MVTEETVRLPGIGFSTRVLRSGEGAPALLPEARALLLRGTRDALSGFSEQEVRALTAFLL
jgi:hypothetical protein